MLFQEGHRPRMKTWQWMLATAYAALLAVGISHHELWQDEMHHFLLARDSGTLSDLFYHARFEGHPLLWNVLLFGLTRFTSDPLAMQVLQGIIAVSAMLVFLRNAPFQNGVKALFPLGYFMLFEYGVFSRNYSLSLLFLFSILAFLAAPKKHYLLIFLCLLVLAASHLFALFCAIPLWVLTVRAAARDENRSLSRASFRLVSGFVLLFFVAIVWSLLPASGHMIFQYDKESLWSLSRVWKGISVFYKGFFPMPDVGMEHWWNSNFMPALSRPLGALAAIACLLIPAFLFSRHLVAFLFFYSVSLSIAVFLYFSPLMGGIRYAGFIYIAFIAALCLEKTIPGSGERVPGIPQVASMERWKSGFVFLVLAVQSLAACFALGSDFQRPFSEGKATAAFLRQSGYSKGFLCVSDQTGGPSLSGYLGRTVFYPETFADGSFCDWGVYPFVLEKEEVLQQIHLVGKPGIFIKNDSSFGEGVRGSVVYRDSLLQIRFLAAFNKAIVRTENYWVYELIPMQSKPIYR